MQRKPSRIQPLAPPAAYKTYAVKVPPTSMRPATCAEVECDPYLNGWEMLVNVTDTAVLHAVRTSGRPFVETMSQDGQWVTFEFDAGVGCRTPSLHRIQAGPELYIARGGDWRGNPTGMIRRHAGPRDFVEDFGEHQLKIIDEIKKG